MWLLLGIITEPANTWSEREERIAGVMSFGRSLMGSSEKLERQLELRAQSLSTEASRTADQGSMHAVHG